MNLTKSAFKTLILDEFKDIIVPAPSAGNALYKIDPKKTVSPGGGRKGAKFRFNSSHKGKGRPGRKTAVKAPAAPLKQLSFLWQDGYTHFDE